MFSISLTPLKSQPLRAQMGFGGINLQGSRRQFIEAQTGFKSISLIAPPGGMSIRLVRYRMANNSTLN